MTLVDLDQLSATDLAELAALRRELELRAGHERVGRLAAVLYGPALGWYRMHRDERA